MTDFFVMYTEEGLPPRAQIKQLAVWNANTEAWYINDEPIDSDLGNQITARAQRLGVQLQRRPTDFFVMHTEEGLAPRARLDNSGQMAVWISDMDAWCVDGKPVDPRLNDEITERATALGVPAFS